MFFCYSELFKALWNNRLKMLTLSAPRNYVVNSPFDRFSKTAKQLNHFFEQSNCIQFALILARNCCFTFFLFCSAIMKLAIHKTVREQFVGILTVFSLHLSRFTVAIRWRSVTSVRHTLIFCLSCTFSDSYACDVVFGEVLIGGWVSGQAVETRLRIYPRKTSLVQRSSYTSVVQSWNSDSFFFWQFNS